MRAFIQSFIVTTAFVTASCGISAEAQDYNYPEFSPRMVITDGNSHDLRLSEDQRLRVKAALGQLALDAEKLIEGVQDRRQRNGILKSFDSPAASIELLEILDGILLPNQMERLRQLTLQGRFLCGGYAYVFESHDVSDRIKKMNVSAEQVESISRDAKSAQSEFERSRKALLLDYQRTRQAIIDESIRAKLVPLTESQRELFGGLFGPPLETPDRLVDSD